MLEYQSREINDKKVITYTVPPVTPGDKTARLHVENFWLDWLGEIQ